VLFDEICITGYQLDSIAGRLLDAGASGVRGVLIGRRRGNEEAGSVCGVERGS